MNSRQKLTEGFINDLSKYYEVEGASLIKRVGDEQPAMLLQVIARLLPKDISLNVTSDITADLSIEQRTRIAEAWLISQGNAPDIEGEAVRVIESESVAALPSPESADQDDDYDDDRIVPDREQEPAKLKTDEDIFEAVTRKHQPRPVKKARVIMSGAKRND